MKAKNLSMIGCMLGAMALGLPDASAAKQGTAVEETALNGAGEKLLARYADQLKALQAEIAKALPAIPDAKKAAFLNACEAETTAAAAAVAAQKASSAKGAKNKEELAAAHAAAQENLAKAQANARQAAGSMLAELSDFLASDKLDAKLVKCALLMNATPKGLAEFAQQGKAQESLVEGLLADDGLMKQMLVAGGAKNGQYGQAMQIYAQHPQGEPESKRRKLPTIGAGHRPRARLADRAKQSGGSVGRSCYRGSRQTLPAL